MDLHDFMAEHATVIEDRHEKAQEDGIEIHELLVKSNKILRISKGAASWKAYEDYISSIVIKGLSDSIQHSMRTVMLQLDEAYLTKNDISPLLEVKLELVGQNIEFTPTIGGSKQLRQYVMGWSKDFCNIAKFIARVDTKEGDYLYEIEEDISLVTCFQELNMILLETEKECTMFADTYRKFEYLWVKGIEECFQEFLDTRGDLVDPKDEEGPRKPPTLQMFDDEIRRYKDIQKEVGLLPNQINILWLKVDSKPI